MTPAELLKRVLAAKGPDREIDAEVCVAFGVMPGVEGWPPRLAEGWQWALAVTNTLGRGPDVSCMVYHPQKEPEPIALYTRAPPALTASLDAALALVGRHFGVTVKAVSEPGTGTDCEAWLHRSHPTNATYEGQAPTPALALIAALLRSLPQ